ncbi:DUF2510 domain-containing protein [Streptomyces sp. NPDC014623]|uniref:DUF2510 domain-containing protein n=1 Tax=Streptomyces sp. NPDC014623 TaxID=3364875 RepID=UPI0036FE68EC
MTNATPSGWYPDVNVPGTERWWDGTAWTGYTRPAVLTQPLSAPLRPGNPATRGGRRATRTVPLAVAGLAVAAAVTGLLVLGDGGTRPEAVPPSSAPPVTATDSASPAAPAPAEGAQDDPTVLVDQLNGVTLPVPDGWEKPENTLDDASTMRTTGSYTCPGDSGSFCHHGTVSVRTSGGTDLTSMKALAEEDIETAAERAYGRNSVDALIHGGIRSQKELESRSVTVAGRTGHLVRRQVTTGKGPGGYVQSLVFPSAVGSGTPVVVRFAFDAGQDGLPLSLMDTITRAIRPIGDATGGGVGSTVAP